MPDTAIVPAPARHANGRFGPGNPGRRSGARNRVSHRAAMAILEDFEANKGEVLERLREYFTPAYFAILTRLLDRELKVETPAFDDYGDAEIAQVVRLAHQALTLHTDPRAALLELEGVLVNHRINGD